jgi:hypothetical protein
VVRRCGVGFEGAVRAPPSINVPLSASERQSGWVLRCSPTEKSVGGRRRWVSILTGRSSQYSSGSRTVVALRSASVMIQILVPLLSV